MSTIAIVLLSVFVALAVADVVTTNLILARGGSELNPLQRWFQERLGSWWWVYHLVAVAAALALALWGSQFALGFLVLVYLWTLANNLIELRRT